MLWSVGVRAAAVAAMLAVAAFHLTRLRRPRRPGRPGRPLLDVALDLTHLAMAAAMLAMISGRLTARESTWGAAALALPAVWLVVRAVHSYVMDGAASDLAAQALGCCGMVAMLALGARASVAGAGMAMGSPSVAPAVLLLVPMVALTGWTAARLRRRAGSEVLAGGCQVLMAGTTALMAAALL